MAVHAVVPNVDADTLLAGAQFINACSIVVVGDALDARHAAERIWDARRTY